MFFISCLNSHSDGTHLLQRIHWWERQANYLSKKKKKRKQICHILPTAALWFSTGGKQLLNNTRTRTHTHTHTNTHTTHTHTHTPPPTHTHSHAIYLFIKSHTWFLILKILLLPSGLARPPKANFPRHYQILCCLFPWDSFSLVTQEWNNVVQLCLFWESYHWGRRMWAVLCVFNSSLSTHVYSRREKYCEHM